MCRRGWVLGVLLLLGGALVVGCGRGSSEATADEETEAPEEVAADEDSGSTPTARRTRKKPAKKKGPHLGGIPLDAFADRPIVTVATRASASPAPTTATRLCTG